MSDRPEDASDGFERLLAGDSAEVIDALRARVAEAPGDETAWLQLGVAYLHIEHWADAAEALGQVVALADTFVEARLLYAQALSRCGKLDAAAFQLVQARRLAPSDARVAHALGVAFYDKGLYAKAAGELNRARGLAPGDGRICYALGLVQEARGDVAAAIGLYRQAIRHDPQLVEAHKTLADALAAIGELAEAVTQQRQVLRLERTNPQNALNLEALEGALDDLHRRRLLGKSLAHVAGSALVQRGELARRDPGAAEGEVTFESDALELVATVSEEGQVQRLVLVLRDPERAAATVDERFGVTVVSEDGRQAPADLGTGATLTFLREALGCPMTRASALYAALLAEREAAWGGAHIGFDTLTGGGAPRHGVVVSQDAVDRAGRAE